MDAYGGSDVGRVRPINQDYVLVINKKTGPFSGLFILADGMGGHKAGEVASKLAAESAASYAAEAKGSSCVSILDQTVAYANKKLFDYSKENPDMVGMGTTLVIAGVCGSTLYVANVGDSRLYLIDESITQITIDHSLVWEMVSMGKITKEEARNHERKNVITRAVGVEEEVVPDLFEIELGEESIILLCSDGLSNMLEDHEIKRIVSGRGTLGQKVERLIERANEKGGRDNISVILARNEDTWRSL